LIPETATLFNSGLVLLLVLSAVNMSSHILSNSVAVTLLNFTTFFFYTIPSSFIITCEVSIVDSFMV
jgi:hypothetical protein